MALRIYRRGVSFSTALCYFSASTSDVPRCRFSTRTHYDVLGVTRHASKGDIRAAFVALSKKHHPDVSKASNANKYFADINEAYSILINPSKRYQYDMSLHIAEPDARHVHHYHGTAARPFGGYHPGASMYEYTRNYEYHSLSEEEWSRLYQQSMPRPNHSKVIKWLLAMMVVATAVHSFRISTAHRQFQEKHDKETKKNFEIYHSVRERARNSTVEEQLERLAETHNKTLSKRT